MTESILITEDAPRTVTYREAFWVWVKVAIYSFGGPAGQIAVMHKLLVQEKKWIGENRFLHALNYTMLLPGPEAQQLATYIGWLLHRTQGGLTAGILFVLPGFLSILTLSILYAQFQQLTLVQALFFGIKPAVMAVVVEALIRIGKRVLKNRVMLGIAVTSFIAIFFFNVPFPLIVLLAGIAGYAGGKAALEQFEVIKPREDVEESLIPDAALAQPLPSLKRSALTLVIGLAIWFGPLAVLAHFLGEDHILVTEGLFFSQAAVVTFGGAYAVLAFVAQQAVEVYGWLLPGEMLDGLGMAETTPGPLIQVVQFVGFMGAYRHPGAFSPLAAGVLGSIVTTWATFVPCFIWIFLGAPYIEHLRGNKSLTAALSAITAAVVGVVLNLAVWFSLHTVFGVVDETHIGPVRLFLPVLSSVDLAALGIALAAMVAMFRFKVNMLATLGGSAALGMLLYYALGR
jgi:chromate transporter